MSFTAYVPRPFQKTLWRPCGMVVDELQACARCGYCSHKYACAGAQQPPALIGRVLPVLRRFHASSCWPNSEHGTECNVCRFPRGNRHELDFLHRGVTVTGFGVEEASVRVYQAG